jgi:hypothetical protein
VSEMCRGVLAQCGDTVRYTGVLAQRGDTVRYTGVLA